MKECTINGKTEAHLEDYIDYMVIDLKILIVKNYDCKDRSCCVLNPREIYFKFVNVKFYFVKVSRKLLVKCFMNHHCKFNRDVFSESSAKIIYAKERVGGWHVHANKKLHVHANDLGKKIACTRGQDRNYMRISNVSFFLVKTSENRDLWYM